MRLSLSLSPPPAPLPLTRKPHPQINPYPSPRLSRPSPLASVQPPSITGGELGSVGRAIENLELYSDWLENRIIKRFDAAAAKRDESAMADCVAIMCRFGRDANIVTVRPLARSPAVAARRGCGIRVGGRMGGGGGGGLPAS